MLGRLVDQVLNLHGRILALKAINGVILNHIATTQRDRQRIRCEIANMATTVNFEELPNLGPEHLTHFAGGFHRVLTPTLYI